MAKINNFDQARKILNSYVPNAFKPGSYSLDNMKSLMTKLGNPQEDFKTIHIAGTSGKTSTSYYMTALLKQAGQKVGTTVSPHVDEVNERVQINLLPLPEGEFCRQLSEFVEIIDNSGIEPTYFELLVAFAYWVFSKQKVDYAVIEVGLGGLLDGTNVISRPDKVCVITDIGLDHTNVLGKTLPEIATQKAGIIQDHNPIFVYRQSADVMEPVRQRCRQMHAQLHEISSENIPSIPKLPPFQQRNWYLAKSVYDYLVSRDDLPDLKHGQITFSEDTLIPARMERVDYKDQIIIVDGSHNGQKMAAMVEGIMSLYPGKKVAVLVSFVESEQTRAAGALKELKKLTDKLIITSFSGQQDTPKHSVDPQIIAEKAQKIGFKKIEILSKPEAAFQDLLKQPESIKLVTGSFYLLNHIRPLILKS